MWRGSVLTCFCRIAHSPNGWTEGILMLEYIKKNFDRETREKANGRPRVLLLDGHNSHYTQAVLQYARENNIIILGYPPHCTHALQGLDVVCFARMKEAWKEEINAFETEAKQAIGKGDFTGVFGKAFLKSFTPDLVVAAFKATGIHPFDPTVISESQLKPSLATSTKASFPLPQPSPVRRVMSAFRANPPTRFDTDPENLIPPSRSSSNRNTSQSPTPSTLSTTPSRRRTHSVSEFDSLDFTPSKRMRLMSASLGQTQSSYLVSNLPLAETMTSFPVFQPVLEAPPTLPEPNWDLIDVPQGYQTREQLQDRVEQLASSLQHAQQYIKARDLIIEGVHAQLIIQNLILNKQNEVIEARSKKKKDDCTLLFPGGLGRCLTSDEFAALVDAQAAKAAQEEEDKRARAVLRAQKRSKKDLIDARWKEAMEEWKQVKDKHEDECQRLVNEQGVRKCDLPKAPARPLKRDIIAEFNEEEEEGDNGDGEGNDDDDDED